MMQKRTLVIILALWVTIGTLILGQKVTQIKFKGLAHLSPTVAKEVAGIHVGDEMDSEKINESIKNFFLQGYFKDVWVDKKGGVLTYHFEEKLAIANIDIEGYGSGDEAKKLLEGIGVKKGDLYDERRVKKAKKAMLSKLEMQGYYDSVIEITQTPVGSSSLSIVFDVNKGEKIIIKKMNFVGASKLETEALEKELANKEEDTLGWMPWRNNGEASVGQLQYDAYRVKDVFMQNGYVDAYVSKPLMRVDFGSYKAEVDYQIDEGVQYTVGTINIKQSIKGIDSTLLKEALILKSGKVFNIKRMRKDIATIEEQIGNLGYAFVKVSPRLDKHPEQKLLNLEYVVDGGEIVKINDVIISGNDTTKDRVIRRYIYLAPGDTYSSTDLKDSKSSLGRTGFFDSVDIQTQRISSTKVNLLVNVKEASTGTISAGGGYGSYEGLMVNASISDRNIFGSGINTTLGFEISQISTNANLSFVNPKVWDSMYSFGLNFYKRDYKYIDYTQDQLGASMTLGREFLRYFHGSLGIGYVDNQSTINDSNTTTVNDFLYNDQYSKTSLTATVRFDNTDDFYVPREGMKAILNVEYGSLGGEPESTLLDTYSNLFKTSAKFGTYYGLEDLIDYDMILRMKLRGTYISREDTKKLPTAEKLFMGGMGSVRGYNIYSLSAYYEDANGDRNLVGGTRSASGSLEASIPLSEAAKMRLAFFYDYGRINADGYFSDGEFTKVKGMTRSSTGAVVEWQSAFGLINLVFSYPIDEQEGDSTAVFEFSMGSRF